MKIENDIEKKFDDIIFEKRNKEYGAYLLRKKYNRNICVALTISLILTIFVALIPLIIYYLQSQRLMTVGSEMIGTREIKVEIATQTLTSFSEINISDENKHKVPVVVDDTSDMLPISKAAEQNEQGKNELKDNNKSSNELNQNGKQVLGGGFGSGVFGYDVVSQQPFFPGGNEEMNNFIKANIKYPKLAIDYKIQGTVFISVIVETDGRLSNFKIIKGIGAGCDEEVERVVKLMPKWIPGKQNNMYVRVMVLIPVKFIVIQK